MPYTETTDVDGPLALYRTQSLTRSLKSYNCMEGLCEDPPPSRGASACADGLKAFLREPAAISEVRQLQRYLDELFCGDIVNESSINGASAGSSSSSSSCHTSLFPQRKEVIFKLIDKVDLSQAELNKYCFWDGEKPYTRNLVATDHVNYTLLVGPYHTFQLYYILTSICLCNHNCFFRAATVLEPRIGKPGA